MNELLHLWLQGHGRIGGRKIVEPDCQKVCFKRILPIKTDQPLFPSSIRAGLFCRIIVNESYTTVMTMVINRKRLIIFRMSLSYFFIAGLKNNIKYTAIFFT